MPLTLGKNTKSYFLKITDTDNISIVNIMNLPRWEMCRVCYQMWKKKTKQKQINPKPTKHTPRSEEEISTIKIIVVPGKNFSCYELAVALLFPPHLKMHFGFTHFLACLISCSFFELYLNFLYMVHFTDVCSMFFVLFIIPEISFNSEPQVAFF